LLADEEDEVVDSFVFVEEDCFVGLKSNIFPKSSEKLSSPESENMIMSPTNNGRNGKCTLPLTTKLTIFNENRVLLNVDEQTSKRLRSIEALRAFFVDPQNQASA